jgi:hypothetical protein
MDETNHEPPNNDLHQEELLENWKCVQAGIPPYKITALE